MCGVRTDLVDMVFTLVHAGVLIASMSSIGVTLLGAALVAPAFTSRMLTNDFMKIIVLSTLIGVSTALLGMYASFSFNSAPGATIVPFGAAAVGLCALYSFIVRIHHSHYHGDMMHSHPHVHSGIQRQAHEMDDQDD